jgi:hypothetical protein
MSEFQITRAALQNRFTDANIKPGEDGKYSSRQLRAMFEGGMVAVRRAKVEAETRVLEMKAGIMERAYLPRKDLERGLAGVYVGVRRMIERSSIPEAEKRSLFLQLGANTDALMAGIDEPRSGDRYVEPRRGRKREHRGILESETNGKGRGTGLRPSDPTQGICPS